jgi:hypothetical protein
MAVILHQRFCEKSDREMEILAFLFYAPKAHIMYLTVSSSFLISFVMGGSSQSRVIKCLNAPERSEQGDYVPLFTCSSIPHSLGPRPPYDTPC